MSLERKLHKADGFMDMVKEKLCSQNWTVPLVHGV